MIWVKRLAPLAMLAAIFFGYRFYDESARQAGSDQTARHAEVTAKIWLASAYYRNDPDRFVIYRDSVLTQAGLSLEQANEYLDIYSNESERYRDFAQKVAQLVDSLARFDKIDQRVLKLSLPDKDSL